MITSAVKPYSTRYRESMNYYWIVPVASGSPRRRRPRRNCRGRAEMIVPEEHVPIGKRAGDGPAISPDGRTLAYVSNGYLFVMPIGAGRAAGRAGAADHARAGRLDQLGGAGHVLYIATDRLKLVSIADGTVARGAARPDVAPQDPGRPQGRARGPADRRRAAHRAPTSTSSSKGIGSWRSSRIATRCTRTRRSSTPRGRA